MRIYRPVVSLLVELLSFGLIIAFVHQRRAASRMETALLMLGAGLLAVLLRATFSARRATWPQWAQNLCDLVVFVGILFLWDWGMH